MKVPRHQIVEAIGQATMTTQDSRVLAKAIAAYLISEGRENELDSILRDLIAFRAEHGVVEIMAISAHEINDSAKNDIKELLKKNYLNAKQINMTSTINPRVIGGVRVVMPNQQLDLSLRTELANFKHLMIAGKE